MTNTFNPIFKDLQGVSLDTLAETFNEAFATYFIPFKLTPSTLADKMQAENIDLQRSIGCFDDGKLVGFILTGTNNIEGKTVAYNAGTGVIATHRRHHLAERMYEALINERKKEGIDHHILEVIQDNIQAIKLYEKTGFEIVRTFHCFKGTMKPALKQNDFELREITADALSDFSRDWDTNPTWQNATTAIERAGIYTIIGCFVNNTLAGYIVFDPASAKVRQFAVNRQYRRMGIGTALFSAAQDAIGTKDMVITYLDVNDSGTIAFLEQAGLHSFLYCHEMTATF